VRHNRAFWFSLAFWSAFGFLDMADDYFMTEAHGGPPLSLAQAFWLCVPTWVTWGLMTPLVFAVARRVRPAPLGPRLSVHAGMLVLTTTVMALVFTIFESHWGRMHYNKPFSLRHWGHNILCWTPMALIVYGACVGIAYAIDYAKRTREQQVASADLARQLAHAQLGALRMQLQPHFFFNTLNSISMMVRAGENRRAVEMLAGLGDVLRTLLRRSPALETTFSDELAFLRRYLEIEEVRFGERLTIQWDVDAGVDEALVPPLLLQPLIENALRHGLDPRPDGGVLSVAAHRRGEAFEIVVSDNGVGLRPGFSADDSTGLGLTNTRARLERMYGAAAALDVQDAPGGGVRVCCKLPYHVQAVSVVAGEALLAHG
jgi:two-component system LytT family sensor kinase